ncbi:hypothetical protein FSP39_021502 [Pinctada imbricata]|uniref:Uncharacterized protein n=1 Tax=Pinctada imbricata TaxID=66713 RepID=A0AA88YJB1_PINIB|nr:hypothetical protein FSP39_021502 [Pinctada imbricata]
MNTSEEDISVQYGAQCAVLREDRPMDNSSCTSLETRDEHKDNDDCNVDCNPNKEISLDSGYFSTSEICSNLDESFEKSVKDSDNQPRNDECLGGKEGNSELSSDKATDDEWKDESGLCSSEDSMRGQSTFHTNKNPPMKLDKERTLFADEKTFRFTSDVQKEESNADDDDEDDPFYLSIRMLAKLPMIASKPRFKTGSITDKWFPTTCKAIVWKTGKQSNNSKQRRSSLG